MVASEKGSFGSPSSKVTNFTYLLYIQLVHETIGTFFFCKIFVYSCDTSYMFLYVSVKCPVCVYELVFPSILTGSHPSWLSRGHIEKVLLGWPSSPKGPFPQEIPTYWAKFIAWCLRHPKKEEYQLDQAFFTMTAHESWFVHGLHSKNDLVSNLTWWKVR